MKKVLFFLAMFCIGYLTDFVFRDAKPVQAQGYSPVQIYLNGVEVKPDEHNKINIFISPKAAQAYSSPGNVTIIEELQSDNK